MRIEFMLNGTRVSVDAPADSTLLTVLRDQLNMTAPKKAAASANAAPAPCSSTGDW